MGDFITHTFRLTHAGGAQEIYDLALELPEDWESLDGLDPVTLDPGEADTIFITVFVPFAVVAGDYEITLTATARVTAVQVTASASVKVLQVAEVMIQAPPGAQALPGSQFSYTFAIVNRGNAPDVFEISADSAHDWIVEISEDQIELVPGERGTFDITLQIPLFASEGRDRLTVEVMSTVSSEVSDRVTLFTTVLPPSPQGVGRRLFVEVPAEIGLMAGGSPAGVSTSQLKLFAEGGIGADRQFSLESTLGGLTTPTPTLNALIFNYETERYRLRLGNISTEFAEFANLSGRGAQLDLGGERLGVTVLGLEVTGGQQIGAAAGLTGALGPIDASLSYIGRFDQPLNLQTDLLDLSLAYPLSDTWTIGAEGAISRSASGQDVAWWLGSVFQGENAFLSADYVKIGTEFVGERSDEAGFRVSHQLSFRKLSLSLRFLIEQLSDNVAGDPTQPTVTTTRLLSDSTFSSPGFPALGFGTNFETRRSRGPAPRTDEEEVALKLSLAGPLGPFSYRLSGNWGEIRDRIAATRFSSVSYDVSLRLARGRFSGEVGYVDRTVSNAITSQIEDRSIEERLLLTYELSPSLSASLSADRDELGGTTTLTPKFTYRLGGETEMAVGGELGFVDGQGDVTWTAQLEYNRGFSLPLPWIKTKGQVEGYVFIDENGNGRPDDGEAGLSRLVLRTGHTGVLTDETGLFRYPPLEPGEYELVLDNPPADLVPSIQLPQRFELARGEVKRIDIPMQRAAYIDGRVFDDQNRDGQLDPGEPGVTGVRVALMTAEGEPIREGFTGPTGWFAFTGLLPGGYRLRVDETWFPPGYEPTTPQDRELTLEPESHAQVQFGAAAKERGIIFTLENTPPTALFVLTPDRPTILDEIRFADRSTDPDGEITRWLWDFGDGGESDEPNPIHRYRETGTYQVRLTVTDDLGSTDTAVIELQVVNALPQAAFDHDPDTPTAEELVRFVDRSQDPDGEIISWLWDFGDGATAQIRTPQHTYPRPGRYRVTLIVTDDDRGQNTVSREIEVLQRPNRSPVADFSFAPQRPLTGQILQFFDRSTDPDGNITTWRWDFGDGRFSTERNPIHRYEQAGTYRVSLQVVDDDGARNTILQEIHVEAPRGAIAVEVYRDHNGNRIREPEEELVEEAIEIRVNGREQTIVGREVLADLTVGRYTLEVIDRSLPTGLVSTGPATVVIELRQGEQETIPFGLARGGMVEVRVLERRLLSPPVELLSGVFAFPGTFVAAPPVSELEILPDSLKRELRAPTSRLAFATMILNSFQIRQQLTRTMIGFHLSQPAEVTAEILDQHGEVVRTLLKEESLGHGLHYRVWDGRAQTGRVVPEGTSRYRVSAEGVDGDGRSSLLEGELIVQSWVLLLEADRTGVFERTFELGLVVGVAPGEFAGDRAITAWEAKTILARALNREKFLPIRIGWMLQEILEPIEGKESEETITGEQAARIIGTYLNQTPPIKPIKMTGVLNRGFGIEVDEKPVPSDHDGQFRALIDARDIDALDGEIPLVFVTEEPDDRLQVIREGVGGLMVAVGDVGQLTDETGRASFTGVGPGRHRVRLFPESLAGRFKLVSDGIFDMMVEEGERTVVTFEVVVIGM
ncbi:MAG: PKD domain-containing protein [Candidatus Bipolaricaulia bacterium]